jgi:hypothetical protein
MADPSTITVTIPAGGSFGENSGDSCGANNGDCIVFDTTNNTSGKASWVGGSGTTLTIAIPMNISPGDALAVTLANASNGPTPDASGFSVATSSDPGVVSFDSQKLVPETSVADPSLSVSSLAGGATNVQLTATFTATDALTDAVFPSPSGYGQGFVLDDVSTITVTAPAGSSFPETRAMPVAYAPWATPAAAS